MPRFSLLVPMDESKQLRNEGPRWIVRFRPWMAVALWIVVSIQTLVCLCPIFYGTSLYMPQISLTLENARGSPWLSALEESLHLFSAISSDLNGHTTSRMPDISSNVYKFDFGSWCRRNRQSNSVVCSRGRGLDIVSNFVMDFGTQLGELGNADNPSEFGKHLATVYQKSIDDLDSIYVNAAKNLPEHLDEDIDMDKLRIVHQLKKSRKLGLAMWILRLINCACMAVYIKAKFWSKTAFVGPACTPLIAMVVSTTLVVVCELCTFSIVVTEAVFGAVLNAQLRGYGVHIRYGMGYMMCLMELVAGALVGVLAVFG